MASSFTENTRVQVPAALHLCRLGYTYLDNIQEYDGRTNILTDVFIRSVKRLNPLMNDLECQQLIDKIQKSVHIIPDNNHVIILGINLRRLGNDFLQRHSDQA